MRGASLLAALRGRPLMAYRRAIGSRSVISAAEAKQLLRDDPSCLREVAQNLSTTHREALAAILIAKANQAPPPADKTYGGYDLLSTTFLLYLPNRPAPNPALLKLGVAQPLTGKQAVTLFCYNFIPFIGFGIMDNVIMLTCGDYIDNTIGESFGITTLAAAALGNCVSNGLGFATSDAVQRVVMLSGLRSPQITAEQEHSPSVAYLRLIAQILGMVVGCLIGLFPLLFMKEKPKFADRLALSLPREQKAAMAKSLLAAQFEFGDRIIKSGSAVHWVYFIEDGHADVIGQDADGHSIIIAEVGPGDVLGELEVMLQRPAMVDVVACDTVVVKRLHASDFFHFFGSRCDALKERYQSPLYQYYGSLKKP